MNRTNYAFFALVLAGLLLAIYHSYEEVTRKFSPICNAGQKASCQGVFASGHTSIFGIPFYVTGLVWFPLLIVVFLYTTRSHGNPINGSVFVPLLMVGNAFTLYLWYVELGVIGIICPICVSMYVINYALTFLAFVKGT